MPFAFIFINAAFVALASANQAVLRREVPEGSKEDRHLHNRKIAREAAWAERLERHESQRKVGVSHEVSTVTEEPEGGDADEGQKGPFDHEVPGEDNQPAAADPTKADKVQVGAKIGLEAEIRWLEANDEDSKCVQSGKPMWKFAQGEVVADQTHAHGSSGTGGCAEYVTNPIPVNDFEATISKIGKNIKAQLAKVSSSAKKIGDVGFDFPAAPGTDCQTNTGARVMKLSSSTNGISVQLTFSTTLAGMDGLKIEDYMAYQPMKKRWKDCREGYCQTECGSDKVCRGFCTMVCHYAKTHTGTLARPGCKEDPKVLTKISLPDVLVAISENEPASFAKLQTLFGKHATLSGLNAKERVYFECLSAAEFDNSGHGKQYTGKSGSKCIDWDYHGECYASEATKYPSVPAGKKTQTVLEHKEIYKRQALCKTDENCADKATLIVMEMRESKSSLVQGSYRGAAPSGGLVMNILNAWESKGYKNDDIFPAFLTKLKQHR